MEPKHSARFAFGGRAAKLMEDDRAVLNLGDMIQRALVPLGIILGVVLTVAVVAATYPIYSDSVTSIVENVTATDFGDSLTPTLAPTLGMALAVFALAAIVGVVFVAFNFVRSGRGGL